MSIKEDAFKALEQEDIHSLEHLSEWWMEHEHKPVWETKKQYEGRKETVLPMIIGLKLDTYEKEY
jgi:hypothetical protein